MDVLAKLETETKVVGGTEVKTYDASRAQSLSRREVEKVWLLLRPLTVGIESGTFLGYMNGVSIFHIAFKDGKPVAFHVKGDGDGGPFDVTQPEGTSAFSGGRRSRLNRKTRRAKGNRRNTKHRKLRNLASRRR